MAQRCHPIARCWSSPIIDEGPAVTTPTHESPPDDFFAHVPDVTDEDIKFWNERRYASLLCNPNEWFERSRALIATARITKKQAKKLISHTERRALEDVCSMLYGLSLENLFKAHWIFKRYGDPLSQAWTPDIVFPSEIKSHNLVRLAGLIGYTLSDKRRYVLEYLTEAATWSGRYPCPVKAEHDQSTFLLPNTFKSAEKIYRELKTRFTISD